MDPDRNRTRGSSTVTSRRQIAIPVETLRDAGIEVGERLGARSDGPGRIVLERVADVVAELAGCLTGVYQPDELVALRDDWD